MVHWISGEFFNSGENIGISLVFNMISRNQRYLSVEILLCMIFSGNAGKIILNQPKTIKFTRES